MAVDQLDNMDYQVSLGWLDQLRGSVLTELKDCEFE